MNGQLLATSVGRVEVAVTGTGPALLVVHGSPGDWRQGRTLAADFAGSHTVVVPSRPGYGRTPLRLGRAPHQQAAVYRAVLDSLGLDQALCIGISGGGPSAYAFASTSPARCSGLVLCCAVADHLIRPPTAMKTLARLPFLWEASAWVQVRRHRRRLRDPAVLSALAVRELTEAEAAIAATQPQVIADLEQFGWDRLTALEHGVKGLRNDLAQIRRGVVRGPAPWSGPAGLPVAVVHGDHDNVVPLTHPRWHADTIPGAELTVLAGIGHAVPITGRDELAGLVRTIADQAHR